MRVSLSFGKTTRRRGARGANAFSGPQKEAHIIGYEDIEHFMKEARSIWRSCTVMLSANVAKSNLHVEHT
jgi:hypothetical protein